MFVCIIESEKAFHDRFETACLHERKQNILHRFSLSHQSPIFQERKWVNFPYHLRYNVPKGGRGLHFRTVCLNHQASVSPINTSQLAPFVKGRIPTANERRWKSRRRAHLLFLVHCLSECTQLQQSDVLIFRKFYRKTLYIDKYSSTPQSSQ
ncbi:hypothetical protein CEXT_522461 [Caerostris extrusa]|uniref:Uncharacterized protein n=1 Tax=Caerostris extrusa TaxID=172846 RepID=A0AAV4Q9L2_CAEEX|nr:hypothetical protein CEXT_522461 [Caerostris extrusa]